jgi:hypothetical protein
MGENMVPGHCPRVRFLLHTALFILWALIFATPTAAQDDAYLQTPQPEAQTFDDQTMAKYASSLVEIQYIQNEFTHRMLEVRDQEQINTMRQEMHTKMVKAVQDQGLDVETFNAIAKEMNFSMRLQESHEKRE